VPRLIDGGGELTHVGREQPAVRRAATRACAYFEEEQKRERSGVAIAACRHDTAAGVATLSGAATPTRLCRSGTPLRHGGPASGPWCSARGARPAVPSRP